MLKRESNIKTVGMLVLFVVVLIMGGCDDIGLDSAGDDESFVAITSASL